MFLGLVRRVKLAMVEFPVPAEKNRDDGKEDARLAEGGVPHGGDDSTAFLGIEALVVECKE
jgi:hypothetical protein